MRLGYHIFFWVVMMALLTIVFGNEYGDYSKSLFFVSFLLPVAMGTSYFFNYYLVPRYLLTRQHFRFVIYSIYLLIVSAYLEMVVVTLSFIVIANYNIQDLDPIMSNIFVLCFAVYVIVFLKAFLLLYLRVRNHEFEVDRLREQNLALKMDTLTIRVDRTNLQIRLSELYLVESMDDYVALHLNGKKLMTKETISTLEEKLPDYFIRIHRSFLVNKNHISSFNTTWVMINDYEYPISRTYKNKALSLLM